jgi:phosphatidylglycerophosphatase A
MQAILRFIVTCGFIGYMPFAPGTYASILGCILIYLFPLPFNNLPFVVLLVVFSVFCVNLMRFEDKDPGYIVIDELAGMCVAMAGHSVTLVNVAIGFVFFRGFDILKPFPIRQAEGLRRGYGIVADDVIAGIFANALLIVCGRIKWY